MEINQGITAFDERTDFSRNNPDRKPWGRSGFDAMDVRSEYDAPTAPIPTQQPGPPEPIAPPSPKFTHKLANGTVLEAATVEELATQIEKAAAVPPQAPPLEFEEKPLYQPYEFKAKDLTLQEQADILNLMKTNPQQAIRQLQEADLGVPVATIIDILQRTQQVVKNKMEEEASVEFIMEAETYHATPANGKKLLAYLKEKGKPITKNNLMVAFNQMVAAGDKNLVRPVTIETQPQEDVEEVPPPPVVVPSNQGMPPAPSNPTIDAAKFAALPLDKQKEFFRNLKRA